MLTIGRVVPDRGGQRVYVRVIAVRRPGSIGAPRSTASSRARTWALLGPGRAPSRPTLQRGRLCPPAAMTARTRRSC